MCGVMGLGFCPEWSRFEAHRNAIYSVVQFHNLFLMVPTVITWLNKQLNENQLTRKQEALGVFETPAVVPSAAALRMGNPSHNMAVSPSAPCILIWTWLKMTGL